jgi:hypothetical protein
MNKFNTQIHTEELAYEPTQADWQEYNEWLESQEAAEPELEPSDFDRHRDFYAEMDSDEYEWTEEAIEWEEGMHPDNLYGDEDFDGIGDNELYEDQHDYDAWEEYCDYE